ncbi:hypothetical protein C1N74_15995 (plasmid) [Microbacterium sp. SGAir0570]|nr:hypothetical protein C1N74_15995 [Microbacterium sp. SGAir0570]
MGMFTATGTYSGGYSYAPYGEARATSTNGAVAANNLRYIGEHHEGAGIYKLGARYYDTTQGRFTQMDPSGQEDNAYAYASCNPINIQDPTGLAGWQCALDVTAVIGGAYTAVQILGLLSGSVTLGFGTLVTTAFLLNGVATAFDVASATESCQ